MATINEIPDDVLETHILPLATEETKLRERIVELENVRNCREKELDELRTSFQESRTAWRKQKDEIKALSKLVKYYKMENEKQVSDCANSRFSESDDGDY
tara:strand:- start:355 stop:654 length:300 start_codon:yes stop_codon:yes gene_type:complete